jgi:hypothetical protein
MVVVLNIQYNHFTDIMKSRLKIEMELVSQGIINEGVRFLENIDMKDYHIILIGSDNTVLYHNGYDNHDIEKIADDKAVKQALSNGSVENSRYTKTFTQNEFYCAKKLPNGNVIKLSTFQYTIVTLFLKMIQPIAIIFIIVTIISFALSSLLSKKTVSRLNALDLDSLSYKGYEELYPLFEKINVEKKRALARSIELKYKQKEFDSIIKNMNEGIVLLNKKYEILSINSSACHILDIDQSIGKNFLEICHNSDIIKYIEDYQCIQKVYELNRKHYLLIINHIHLHDETIGTFIFLEDIDEYNYS